MYYECKIDETRQGEPGGQRFTAYDSPARAVIDSREVITLGMYPYILRRELIKILSFLAYASETPSRKKRTPMDVPQMIKDWIPLIRQLACAHDVDEKDFASAKLDDLLTPIIAAPVTQIRDFYRGLTVALKADKTIPWAVWKLFEFWGTNILDKIDKDGVVELKKQMATRIAERSMEQIPREDWVNSMIGALQWRDPERLEKVEKAMEAGHKPRLRGRESCLFLEVGDDADKAQVML